MSPSLLLLPAALYIPMALHPHVCIPARHATATPTRIHPRPRRPVMLNAHGYASVHVVAQAYLLTYVRTYLLTYLLRHTLGSLVRLVVTDSAPLDEPGSSSLDKVPHPTPLKAELHP